MDGWIIFWAIIGFLLILIVFFVLVFTKLPGRSKAKTKYIEADPQTGAFIYFAVNRRKYIQPFGDGHEIHPAGIGKKPVPMQSGWMEFPNFPNVLLVLGKGFMDKIEGELMKRVTEYQLQVSRLTSENAELRTEIFQLRSQGEGVVNKSIDRTTDYIKKIQPIYQKPKSSSGGGYQGNYSGGSNE